MPGEARNFSISKRSCMDHVTIQSQSLLLSIHQLIRFFLEAISGLRYFSDFASIAFDLNILRTKKE
jgi:hypothetical protein